MNTENYEEARKRSAADPGHSYAEHMSAVVAEKDAELHPLPGKPISDEDRHRWIRYIAATKFLSYAEAANVFTARVQPQLQRAAEIRARVELARRVAEAQPRALTIYEQRLGPARLAAKRAAAARKARMAELDRIDEGPEAA